MFLLRSIINFPSPPQYPTPLYSAAQNDQLKLKSMKKCKIISLPNINENGRTVAKEEDASPASNNDPGTSKSESGLKLNIDGRGDEDQNATVHHSAFDEDDDDDDFGDEEIDDFDDSVIQSAAAIMDRGEKKLYNKLRPNVWSAKVVSTPNIWHKD